MKYKLADFQAEREAAFRLVYDRYLDAGLIEPNEHGVRVTPFHLLSTTDVVLAVRRRRVVSTVSLIRDAELGLQMESIYGPEIARLRRSGQRLAEVSCFATQSCLLLPSEMLDVFLNLVAFTVQLARHHHVDQLVIAVHPAHEAFYRRLLGFRRIGPERCYPAVCDNLAVACGHEFARLDRQRYALYDLVYEVSYAPAELVGRPMGRAERRYFRGLIETPAIVRELAA